MKIGELARRTGCSVRSLRYYESQGLLHAERTPSGYREFTEADVETTHQITALLDAGLPTRTIEHVLPCLALHDGEPLALTCSDLLGELMEERAAMAARIANLQASVAALDTVIAASPTP